MRYDGVDLDFHQPLRPNEGRHLKYAVGRADIAEELAMHAAHRLPMGDVDEIYPRANHVLKARSRIRQSLLDDFENGASLGRWIAHGDWLTAGARSRAGDCHNIADAHRAGKADDRLKRAAGGN